MSRFHAISSRVHTETLQMTNKMPKRWLPPVLCPHLLLVSSLPTGLQACWTSCFSSHTRSTLYTNALSFLLFQHKKYYIFIHLHDSLPHFLQHSAQTPTLRQTFIDQSYKRVPTLACWLFLTIHGFYLLKETPIYLFTFYCLPPQLKQDLHAHVMHS